MCKIFLVINSNKEQSQKKETTEVISCDFRNIKRLEAENADWL